MKAKDYLAQYEAAQLKKKSPNTVKAYIADLKQFFAFIDKDLEDVKHDDIVRYTQYLLSQINKRKNKPLEPKTVNRKLVSVRQYIDWINKNEMIDINIFIDIELIKIQKQEYLDEVLTKTDFDRIVRAAEKDGNMKAVAVFNTLYFTGVRVSELTQFTVGDIKTGEKFVRGKGNKYRRVVIPEKLKAILLPYIKQRGLKNNQYLFINDTNNNPMQRQSIHNMIKSYAGQARVKLSKAHAHSFRHLCALRMIEEGATLDEVADILGHSNINTTRIYTRKTGKELRNIQERL